MICAGWRTRIGSKNAPRRARPRICGWSCEPWSRTKLKRQIQLGESHTKFSYSFSPSPENLLKKTFETGNPLNGFSKENKEAHVDVIKTQSYTKLFVGGYVGTMRLINKNTVHVTITNETSANSFLLHLGELIFGNENGAKQFNDLWNKTPFLNTQSQRFEFNIPINK